MHASFQGIGFNKKVVKAYAALAALKQLFPEGTMAEAAKNKKEPPMVASDHTVTGTPTPDTVLVDLKKENQRLRRMEK